MTPVLLVRHGPSEWNESGHIQGRADPGLSARGRALVATWRLPAAWAQARLVSSPLCRARETATILAGRANSALMQSALIDFAGFIRVRRPSP